MLPRTVRRRMTWTARPNTIRRSLSLLRRSSPHQRIGSNELRCRGPCGSRLGESNPGPLGPSTNRSISILRIGNAQKWLPGTRVLEACFVGSEVSPSCTSGVVRRERFELSCREALVSETSVSAVPPPTHVVWGGRQPVPGTEAGADHRLPEPLDVPLRAALRVVHVETLVRSGRFELPPPAWRAGVLRS